MKSNTLFSPWSPVGGRIFILLFSKVYARFRAIPRDRKEDGSAGEVRNRETGSHCPVLRGQGQKDEADLVQGESLWNPLS